MPDYVLKEPALEPRQVHPVPSIELVGRVEDTEIVIDAVFLDVRAGASPIDRRTLEIGRCRAIAAERALVGRNLPLQSGQIGTIEDEALEVDPFAVEPDLDPAVNDALGRQVIGKAGDGSLCSASSTVKPWNRHGMPTPRSSHERALGIALADALRGTWDAGRSSRAL